MDARIADLIDLLTVKPDGAMHFAGPRKDGGVGRVFGGQVIAQALAAASATVETDRGAHSLHAYFLRMGSEDFPIDYAVENNFDGGSYSNRRVVASQRGTPILTLAASFQRDRYGLAHQVAMPDVPGPDTAGLIEVRDAARDMAATGQRVSPLALNWPFETRFTPGESWLWLRCPTALPDDPALHRILLAYASDYGPLSAALRVHGLNPWTPGMRIASLDHALWFHEPFRVDEWILFATRSPWTGHGRGFSRGRFFARDGRLIAETAQEGMMREG